MARPCRSENCTCPLVCGGGGSTTSCCDPVPGVGDWQWQSRVRTRVWFLTVSCVLMLACIPLDTLLLLSLFYFLKAQLGKTEESGCKQSPLLAIRSLAPTPFFWSGVSLDSPQPRAHHHSCACAPEWTGSAFDPYLSGGWLSASRQIKRWNVFIWPFFKKIKVQRFTSERQGRQGLDYPES